jgi:hypothetical protein
MANGWPENFKREFNWHSVDIPHHSDHSYVLDDWCVHVQNRIIPSVWAVDKRYGEEDDESE